MAERRSQADRQNIELLRKFIEDLEELCEQNWHLLSGLQKELKRFVKHRKETLAKHEQEQFGKSTPDLKQESEEKETAKAELEGEQEEQQDSQTTRYLKEKITDYENKLEVKDKEIEALRNRYLQEKLTDYEKKLELKDREIEAFRNRVALYSEKRTKQDQRHVEDTLSLNRQSHVERDYKNFASDERIDACIVIKGNLNEKTDINARRLTCFIFETVFECVLGAKETMTDAFKDISNFVIMNGPSIGQFCCEQRLTENEKRGGTIKIPVDISLCRSGSEYPRDVLDGLLLGIKESAPDVSTDLFIKRVMYEILSKFPHEQRNQRSCKLFPSEKLLKKLEGYIRACITLTWRMVTQVPPMKIEYQSFTFKGDKHKMTESLRETRPEEFVGREVRYLWPALLDGGGRVLTLAEVIEDAYLL